MRCCFFSFIIRQVLILILYSSHGADDAGRTELFPDSQWTLRKKKPSVKFKVETCKKKDHSKYSFFYFTVQREFINEIKWAQGLAFPRGIHPPTILYKRQHPSFPAACEEHAHCSSGELTVAATWLIRSLYRLPVSLPISSSANAVLLNGSGVLWWLSVNNVSSILSVVHNPTVGLWVHSSSPSRMQLQWPRCPRTPAEWQLLRYFKGQYHCSSTSCIAFYYESAAQANNLRTMLLFFHVSSMCLPFRHLRIKWKATKLSLRSRMSPRVWRSFEKSTLLQSLAKS